MKPEHDLMNRLVDPNRCGWTEQQAQAVLKISFCVEDSASLSKLADQASQGTLTEPERCNFEACMRLCALLDLLKSKARLFLRELHSLHTLLIALLASAGSAIALAPPSPPHDHVLLSDNKEFCAVVRARTNTTTIKQVRRWWPDKTLWRAPLYFEVVNVADNGGYLYLEEDAGLMRQVTAKAGVLTIWLADGTTKTFTVGDFVMNLKTLNPYQVMGSWMADWGHVTANVGDNLMIKTCENRVLEVNVRTGKVTFLRYSKR
jgi:hypothetical protein